MWKYRFAAAAVVGLCLAAAPAMAQNASSSSGAMAAPNQIDISKAGSTPTEHMAFVKAMPPQDQASVIEACIPVIIKPAADTSAAVAAFCKTIADNGVPAAGTSAADNTAFVKSLPADQQANIKAVCVPVVAKPADSSGPMVLATFCKNIANQ